MEIKNLNIRLNPTMAYNFAEALARKSRRDGKSINRQDVLLPVIERAITKFIEENKE